MAAHPWAPNSALKALRRPARRRRLEQQKRRAAQEAQERAERRAREAAESAKMLERMRREREAARKVGPAPGFEGPHGGARRPRAVLYLVACGGLCAGRPIAAALATRCRGLPAHAQRARRPTHRHGRRPCVAQEFELGQSRMGEELARRIQLEEQLLREKERQRAEAEAAARWGRVEARQGVQVGKAANRGARGLPHGARRRGARACGQAAAPPRSACVRVALLMTACSPSRVRAGLRQRRSGGRRRRPRGGERRRRRGGGRRRSGGGWSGSGGCGRRRRREAGRQGAATGGWPWLPQQHASGPHGRVAGVSVA